MSGDLTPAELEELRLKLRWTAVPAHGRFLRVFMDHNNACNLRCRMCGFSDPRVAALPRWDMPRALYERIADQLFPHASYLCLSLMTEPFMTRDFPDRLGAVRRHAVPFSEIITNGTILSADAADKIVAAGISRVTFSIDGGTKEVFESIRTGAKFERVIANFRLMQERRGMLPYPQLRINHVLSEANIDAFDAFLELLERLWPEEITIRTVSRMSDAEIQESRDPVFWAKVRAARAKAIELCRRTGIDDSGFLRDRHEPIEVPGEICRVPWTTLAVYPNGDVFPCMAWSRPPAGNLRAQTFDEIWNGAAMNELRAEFEASRPGVDCLHCTIRRGGDDAEDDFFFRKLAAQTA